MIKPTRHKIQTMINNLGLILMPLLLTCQSTRASHLSNYNQAISSSSFGEPVFRLEPPNLVDFANSDGALIACLASGSPKPTISWFVSSGSEASGQSGGDLSNGKPVTNVTNLIEISQNGAILRLLPFKEADYRRDLHSAEYRCVASNQLGSIHSRSALIQAALVNGPSPSQTEQPERGELIKVNDEFVSLNSPAVLRCRSNLLSSESNQNLPRYVVEWFTSDALTIQPETAATNYKYTAFNSGELHINNVDAADLRRTYGCRLLSTGDPPPPNWQTTTTTTIKATSSGLAQLILTEQSAPEFKRNPSALQILHSTSQIIALQGAPASSRLLIPCAVRWTSDSDSTSELQWFYQQSSNGPLVPLDQLAKSKSIQYLDLRLQAQNDNQTTNRRYLSHKSYILSNMTIQSSHASRFVVGPTYLAIDAPSKHLTGRYVLQRTTMANNGQILCDTNVIIRQSIELSIQMAEARDDFVSAAATYAADATPPASPSWLNSWLQVALNRNKREAAYPSNQSPNNLIMARGAGLIEAPSMVRIGQRLQLNCVASGYPIDEVRWFRNGHLINTQTSSDFQMQIINNQHLDSDKMHLPVISSLIISQTQPRDIGLQMFECFAHNSFGDRVRAGRSILIVDNQLMQWATPICPLRDDNSTSALADEEDLNEDALWSNWSDSRRRVAFILRRLNPNYAAVAVEGDPLELQCGGSNILAGNSSGSEWRKLVQNPTRGGSQQNFNLLFGGDSRFVINGSSLQIRSPSKRHDEATYVCMSGLQSSIGGEASPSPQQQVHQSSSASQSCLVRMASVFGGAGSNQAELAQPQHQQRQISSISVRIVAKLKIDPFDFNRNLEEGMRTVLVCTVVSGQSPIDITWFKDDQLLIAQEPETSINEQNSFSSTLTFHKIHPSHSGTYTCVASNAHSSTNHSSKLVVNVAPYFVEAPKSTKAILNSNVLINCRASGQPSPQIRWRKLVPLNGLAMMKQVAPPAAGQLKDSYDFDSLSQQQMAPSGAALASKYEFRIVTSNSHIQILENGSMIIKEVEMADASRYVCQAFNGINPSLSGSVELQVLTPAQFDVNYETVSVKRDSMIKFNCAPRGDQPMRIEWRKEANWLVPSSTSGSQVELPADLVVKHPQSKYSELAYLTSNASSAEKQRYSSLMLMPMQTTNQTSLSVESVAMKSSELFINYADRSDTGTFVCIATNAYGRDELTYRLVVQEAPDMPLNVLASNVQSTGLKLTWSLAFDGNLPLSHFVVEYRRTNRFMSDPPSGQTGNEWSRIVINAQKLIAGESSKATLAESQQQLMISQGTFGVNLKQLTPKSVYHIRVAAVNAIGQSAFSSPLTVTTTEEPPNSKPNDLRAQPVSSSSIKILWRSPAVLDEQAPIKGYYVSHRKQTQSNKQSEVELPWQATISMPSSNVSFQDDLLAKSSPSQFSRGTGTAGASYEYQINNLEKNAKYEIRVQPYNSMGVGPPGDTLGQTLKFDRPGQPSLKLIAARRQSLELKWSIPDDQPLMGFSLFYKCEYDDWQEIQLGLIYHYVIENLRCGTKYQIYLSAFNVVGRSDPSDVLSARTEGTVPVAPDKSIFFRSNITQVVLDMSGWQSGGCSITSFIVQFKRLHDTNWFVLSEGSQPFAGSDKITIPDLQPATWYKLLVIAINEAGSTNAEYLFSTLTPSGEPIAPNFPPEFADGTQNQQYTTGGWLIGPNQSKGKSIFSSLNYLLGPSQTNSAADLAGANLLLPVSCLLLLLVTSLASYIYYSRSGGSSRASSSSSDNSTGSSSSALRNHQRGSGGVTANGQASLGRSASLMFAGGRLDNGFEERHLIQSSNQQHRLALDATACDAIPLDAAIAAYHQTEQLDSAKEATLHSFMGTLARAGLNQQPEQQNLKLISLTKNNNNNKSSQANSSSISTHSTSCFDGPNSSSAASTSSGPNHASLLNNKPNLQLIDESSLIEESHAQALGYPAQHQLCSPGHTVYGRVCDVSSDGPSSQLIDMNLANFFASQQQQQLYSQPRIGQRLVASNSFASANDLLQHRHCLAQLEHHHTGEEPIYQRLDRCYGRHLSNSNKAQTLRFNHSHSTAAADEQAARAMTLHRANLETGTICQDECYYPPPPAPIFQQQFQQDIGCGLMSGSGPISGVIGGQLLEGGNTNGVEAGCPTAAAMLDEFQQQQK